MFIINPDQEYFPQIPNTTEAYILPRGILSGNLIIILRIKDNLSHHDSEKWMTDKMYV